MNKILKIGFLFFLCLGTGCNKDEETPIPTIFTQLEGSYQFENGILDGMRAEIWNEASMEISIVSDSSIKVICANQPKNREKIWPDQSILYLKPPSKRTFYRDDEIDIHIWSFEDELNISMQPPRDWSYDKECEAPEVNAFQCSSEGTWNFILNRINE